MPEMRAATAQHALLVGEGLLYLLSLAIVFQCLEGLHRLIAYQGEVSKVFVLLCQGFFVKGVLQLPAPSPAVENDAVDPCVWR